MGRHGLIIKFTDPLLQCRRTATFLPEVAADQGWSRRQCLESLIRKAGEPRCCALFCSEMRRVMQHCLVLSRRVWC